MHAQLQRPRIGPAPVELCSGGNDAEETPAANDDTEMGPGDYVIFVGYIGAFVAIFYAAAALLTALKH